MPVDRSQFDAIANGIMAMSEAFNAAGINPGIIELADPEHGARLKYLLPPHEACMIFAGMDAKGEPRNQIEICGIIVRWPAQRRARLGGGFEYV